MIQRTMVLLKPDALRRGLGDEIIKRFTDRGLEVIEKSEPFMASDEILLKHYPLNNYQYILTLGHVDPTNMSIDEKKFAYDKNYKIVLGLHEYLKEGPIVKMILKGEDAVALVREIIGKTDPAGSPKGSIRRDFGEDSFAKADKESRFVRNLIHASGNPEEAEAEIKLWFGE